MPFNLVMLIAALISLVLGVSFTCFPRICIVEHGLQRAGGGGLMYLCFEWAILVLQRQCVRGFLFFFLELNEQLNPQE